MKFIHVNQIVNKIVHTISCRDYTLMHKCNKFGCKQNEACTKTCLLHFVYNYTLKDASLSNPIYSYCKKSLNVVILLYEIIVKENVVETFIICSCENIFR